MRLIDVDALTKYLRDTYCDTSRQLWNFNRHVMAMGIIDVLENCPAVEERKHGHYTEDYKCSVCGAERPTQGINKWIYLGAKYCYNCGAKMDEEVKE